MPKPSHAALAKRHAPVVAAMKELGLIILAVEPGPVFTVSALLSGKPWLVIVDPSTQITRGLAWQRRLDEITWAGCVVAVVKNVAELKAFVAGEDATDGY